MSAIIDIIRSEALTLSFEIFPPKADAGFGTVLPAAERIAALEPAYISVTYGAGGGSRNRTLSLAEKVKAAGGTQVLPHLTCVGSTADTVTAYLKALRDHGITSVMALRGDLPEGADPSSVRASPFPYAADLIRAVKAFGPFCVGAACYPEVHPESATQAEDLRYLREKVDAGADFLTTQMFFDNNVLYNFLYKLREAGVTVPVVPGIMPITDTRLIKRARSLSGCVMPRRFNALADRFGSLPAAMKQAGIIYACDQIIDLFANGIRHVHVYTMNKPGVAAQIVSHLSELLGRAFL